jgi:hypothetical protein
MRHRAGRLPGHAVIMPEPVNDEVMRLAQILWNFHHLGLPFQIPQEIPERVERL